MPDVPEKRSGHGRLSEQPAISVRLFPDERAALQKMAEQQERSMAWLGRHAILVMLGLEKPAPTGGSQQQPPPDPS